MLKMITTNFVERLYEEAIQQRLHQAKGLMQRTTYTAQTRNQVCGLR